MDVEALDRMVGEAIEQGYKPFHITSLSGTTVLGGYDDTRAINAIAKKYGVWHHVDTCWGGFLQWASPEKKGTLFDGVELVDSLAFNPHKGWGVPQQCSALIVNGHPGILHASNSSGAGYLFQESPTAKYDIGDKTIFCGRRADSMKLFMTLRKHGKKGLRALADRALDNSRYMVELLKSKPNYTLAHEPMATNICFWYIPPYYMEHPDEWNDDAKIAVHKYMYKAQKEKGAILVQHNPLPADQNDTGKDIPNMFRLVIKGEKSDFTDMDFILEEIERLGKDITPELLATEEY